MNYKILIIIGAAVIALIILFILFLTISNKRKSKKLQENLNKYKNENKESDDSISLMTEDVGKNLSEDELFNDFSSDQTKEEDEIEDFDDLDFKLEDFLPSEDKLGHKRDHNRNLNNYYDKSTVNSSYDKVAKERKARDDDFEQFLDEHSFTRKAFDKSLLSQIKNLPPEIKAVIMSNVFDKFNDDDK